MDRLWSPWRYKYVSSASAHDECIFCAKAASADDAANFVVLRGERNFVLLNLYPYTNGHVLIATYEHTPDLEQSDPETLAEMMTLTARVEKALRALYKP